VIESFETSVPDKELKVVGGDGLDEFVMEKLSKWSTASKKSIEFVGREEVTA